MKPSCTMTNSQSDLIVQFDDLMSCTRVLWENSCAEDFLKYLGRHEALLSKYDQVNAECKRLKEALDESVQDISTLDSKLKKARQLLDVEKRQVLRLESERDAMVVLLDEVRGIVCNDAHCKLSEETKNQLTVITSNNGYGRSINRFGSQSDLESSELSITRSDADDLDVSTRRKSKRKLTSVDEEPYSITKKKSSMYPALAPLASRPESLESTESEREVVFDSKNDQFTIFDRLITRTHRFEDCTIRIGAECLSCGKKIRLRAALKCAICSSIFHVQCRSAVPLPCVPMGPTTKSGVIGNIGDYAPPSPPFVPAIVSHCIYEIERRGLQEKGIYRVSGDHKEVQELKEKFLKCKVVPNLSKTEINSVCSFLKEFLRSLNDPLIPNSKWHTFAQTISDDDKITKLCEAVCNLPGTNRDTLAFLILHLQKVSQTPACHMTVYNLATVFGPTIIGYSDPANPLVETEITNRVMVELLSLKSDFWSNFLDDPRPPPPTLINDTCCKELSRKTPRKYFKRW